MQINQPDVGVSWDVVISDNEGELRGVSLPGATFGCGQAGGGRLETTIFQAV